MAMICLIIYLKKNSIIDMRGTNFGFLKMSIQKTLVIDLEYIYKKSNLGNSFAI